MVRLVNSKIAQFIALGLLFQSAISFAGSHLIKADLDLDSTVIVKADLDILGFYYYIDKNACICWVAGKSSVEAAPSVFDCAKLKVYPQLKEHIRKCTGEMGSDFGGTPAAETAPAPAPVKPEPDAEAPAAPKKK